MFVNAKSVQGVGVSLQSHQKSSVGYISRPAKNKLREEILHYTTLANLSI